MPENNLKKIEIFSTPTCHFCNLAKDWFKEKGLEYHEYDVASDMDKRKEMVEITGQLGVPVIKIDNDIAFLSSISEILKQICT